METTKNLYQRRERELVEDIVVLEKAIKNFWEILPIPACTTSPIFIILETGKSFDTLFNYKKDELIGETLKKVSFDKNNFEALLDNLSIKRKVSNIEIALKAKDGDKILALVSAIAQEDDDREAFSYLFSFVDVTLIKKTEEELQEKVVALEKFQKIAIGRELKMVELKEALGRSHEEVKKLIRQLAEKN
ncbi:MAG: PAS domain-containing protein [bacterium]|nr:PAS domain-containing protein [bacterium]